MEKTLKMKHKHKQESFQNKKMTFYKLNLFLHNCNLCYFQVRESPTRLNIPTLTSAPDWGGPDVTDVSRYLSHSALSPMSRQHRLFAKLLLVNLGL